MGRILSKAGLNFIMQHEGCRLSAYKDIGGVYTIGYGHTKGVKAGMIIDNLTAEQFLVNDIAEVEKQVNKIDTLGNYNFNQSQFDALCSFTFNLGYDNLLKLTKIKGVKRSISEIAKAIPLYNKVNGKEVAGLVTRRNNEVMLFTSEDRITNQPIISNVSLTVPSCRPNIKRGCKNPERVKQLQLCLNYLLPTGRTPLEIDGSFGALTYIALEDFQRINGLKVDGIYGKNTMLKMHDLIGG